MSFSILNIIYDNYLNIDNKDCISISYPHFEKHLNSLTVKLMVEIIAIDGPASAGSHHWQKNV